MIITFYCVLFIIKLWSYYPSDISKIINNIILTEFNYTEKNKPIEIAINVNRYAILIAIKKDWELELDQNFMDSFGFEKNIFKEGYHISSLIPNLDKTKFLKFIVI